MVEVVKLFLAAWTLKNIQIKLIHLLGGISKDDVIKVSSDSFSQGYELGGINAKRRLITLENNIYGKPEQEWINIIHAAIKDL